MMKKISLKMICEYLDSIHINYSISGSEDVEVYGFCSLLKPKDNSITWIKKIENVDLSSFDGNESNIIVAPSQLENSINHCAFVITPDPKACFFSILSEFWGEKKNATISKSSIIKGKLGNNVSVGENCFVGENVSVGDNTIIEHGVKIFNGVSIGENCIIHSGAVIGTDGFGYFFDEDDTIHKVKHFGGVFIGNDVEIGANACVDRGTLDDTEIGNNCKIDNLVHIAHNVILEDSVAISANAIICGSAYLSKGTYIAPGAIVKNQIRVKNKGFVGIGAVAVKTVEEKSVVVGVPAKEIRKIKKGDK